MLALLGVRLSSFYFSVFLLFWLSKTEVCRVLNLTRANSAKHTSVDYADMAVFPVPTLIGFLN